MYITYNYNGKDYDWELPSTSYKKFLDSFTTDEKAKIFGELYDSMFSEKEKYMFYNEYGIEDSEDFSVGHTTAEVEEFIHDYFNEYIIEPEDLEKAGFDLEEEFKDEALWDIKNNYVESEDNERYEDYDSRNF